MKTFIYFAILALILSSTSFVLAKDGKISEDQNELYDIQPVGNTELIPQNFETFGGTDFPWNYSGTYTQIGSDGCIISGDFQFSVNEDGTASGGYRPKTDSCRPDWGGYSYFFSVQGTHLNESFNMVDGLAGTYSSLNMSGSRSDGIIVSAERDGGGVITTDGKLYLSSPLGGILELSGAELPPWALAELVTVGAAISCVGPPATVMTGDPTVLLGGKPVARLNDKTSHGGNIEMGSDRIFVNGVPAAFLGGFTACPMNTGPISHIGGPIVTFGWMDDPFATQNELLEQSKLNPDLCTESALSNLDSPYDDGGALANWCSQRLKTLIEIVSKGDTILKVDGTGIEIGDAVFIGSDTSLTEVARVIGKGSLILDRPLENSYPAGTLVMRVPDQYANELTGNSDGGNNSGGGGGGGCFIGTLRY